MDTFVSSPGNFPLDSFFEEELLESFYPSFLELEPRLDSVPSIWLDDGLGFYDDFDDSVDGFAASSEVNQYCKTRYADSIEDHVITTGSHLGAGATEKVDDSTTESSQTLFSRFPYEFKGGLTRVPRRNRKKYSPLRRKAVNHARKA